MVATEPRPQGGTEQVEMPFQRLDQVVCRLDGERFGSGFGLGFGFGFGSGFGVGSGCNLNPNPNRYEPGP